MGVYGVSRITAKVLKVLRQEVKGTSTLHLRVVSWVINGRESDVRLEKRERSKSHFGEERDGTIKGLNSHDVAFILEHQDEIRALMGIRPPPRARALEQKDYTEPSYG
jgi:hypothetical protein